MTTDPQPQNQPPQEPQPQEQRPPEEQPAPPPETPPETAPAMPAGNPKSKICAGILGILLGQLGVHNFYLGYNGKGVAQLILSVIGSLTPLKFLVAIAWIWGLIEGIMILAGKIEKDGKGLPLT